MKAKLATPDLERLRHSIEDVIPHEHNPNEHDEKQVREFMAAFKTLGQDQPIIVNRRTMKITEGHGRLEAAMRLGWEDMAINWTDETERAAMVRMLEHHGTELEGTMDRKKLAEQLGRVAGSVPGYDKDYVRTLGAVTDPKTEGQEDPDPPAAPGIRQIILTMDTETFDALTERLDEECEKRDLQNYTDTVTAIMEEWEAGQ